MPLEEYKDIVGAAAGLVTFCQMFSGVFLCKDIYNHGTTINIPATPFIGGLILSILLYQNSLLINDEIMGLVNLGGAVLNICYLLFYYNWTQKNQKLEFYKKLFQGIAFTALLLFYVQIENPEKVEVRFGIVLTILLLVLIASPLFSLGEVIKTKSTESLPFPMIISGCVVSAHWLLYGFIIKNSMIIFQNFVGLILCLIELSLFLIYPRKVKSQKKIK